MQYTLVLEEDGISLIRSVKEKIADGWTPLGGVSVTSDVRQMKPVKISFDGITEYKTVLVFAQAMIKE